MPLRSGVQVSLNPVLRSCPCVGGSHDNASEELLLEITVRFSTGYASARMSHKMKHFNLSLRIRKRKGGYTVRTHLLQ